MECLFPFWGEILDAVIATACDDDIIIIAAIAMMSSRALVIRGALPTASTGHINSSNSTLLWENTNSFKTEVISQSRHEGSILLLF